MVVVGAAASVAFALLTSAAALLSAIGAGGWILSTKPIAPQFNRLNPISGLANLFSKQQMANVAKMVLMSAILTWVAWRFIGNSIEAVAMLVLQPSPLALRQVADWLTSGMSLLLLVVFLAAAVVGLAVSNVQAVGEQGRAVTDDYYQALVAREWSKAYDQLCDDARRRESRPEFEQRVATEPQISGYRVGDVDTASLTVPVDVTLAGGRREAQTVTLAPDRQTGGMEVCGVS